MKRWRSLAVLVSMLAVLAAAPAIAAEPQTNLPDVEDEVMCPICGTLLELSESPQAQRQRSFVRGLIAAGKTKAQVKDALVAEYGRAVLALPGDSGFDLTAYLVPAIAFVAAVLALALGVRRWRRAGGPPPPRPGAGSAPEDDEAERERLEQDMARYDL